MIYRSFPQLHTCDLISFSLTYTQIQLSPYIICKKKWDLHFSAISY